MLTRFRIPLVAMLSIVLFASCTKTNKQGRNVPKDAAFVLHIDGNALASKISWSDIKQNALFQQLYTDTTVPAFVKQALDSPANSGIDTKGDLLFFAQKDSIGGISAITGTIKDADKFKLFCMDLTKGGNENEKDGVNFITKAPMCIGWNKEKFLIIVDAPEFGQSKYEVPSANQPQYKDLFIVCNTLFRLDESNSLGENEKFTALVKTPGDLHLWMNAENMNGLKQLNKKLPMVDLAKLTDGNITTATVNFENGKILLAVKSYASKEMAEVYKKFSGKNFDEEMIKRLPTKDVAAVFALGYNPAAINDFIKVLGLDGLAPLATKFVGFSIEDFIKANKGDLMIAVGDFKSRKDSFYVTKDSFGNATMNGELFNTIPDVVVATSISDKDAFNKVIKASDKFIAPLLSSFSLSYNSNEKYFVVGSSKDNIDKYLANNKNSNYDFLSKISGNPFGGYINFQYIMKSFGGSDIKDSVMKTMYDASLKTWDNAFIKGGDYSDGGITQSIEINLMDKNTNSLKQLNQYIGLVGKLKMEMNKKDRQLEIEQGDIIYPPLSKLGDSTKVKK